MCIRGFQIDDTGHSVLKPRLNFEDLTGVPGSKLGTSNPQN